MAEPGEENPDLVAFNILTEMATKLLAEMSEVSEPNSNLTLEKSSFYVTGADTNVTILADTSLYDSKSITLGGGCAEYQIATIAEPKSYNDVIEAKQEEEYVEVTGYNNGFYPIVVLEQQEIYGDFKVIRITKDTPLKDRKKLSNAFNVLQDESWSSVQTRLDESNLELSLDTTHKRALAYHLRLFLKLFTSEESTITSTFIHQEKELNDELRWLKKQKVDLLAKKLPSHFQEPPFEELRFDVYNHLQPSGWLSEVVIDTFSKRILTFHDNYYANQGKQAPSIKIITSGVFSKACVLESTTKLTSKKQKTCKGFATAVSSTITTLCYERVRWFPGARDYSDTPPHHFKVGQDRVFIPFNRRDHHWALVYLYGPQKMAFYFDSLWTDGSPVLRTLLFFLSKMASQAKDCEDLAPWLRDFNPLEWTLVDLGGDSSVVPQQGNGWDCGVYVCIFMTYLICLPRPYLIFRDDDAFRSRNKKAPSLNEYTFQLSVDGFRRKMVRLFFDKTIEKVTTFEDFLEKC